MPLPIAVITEASRSAVARTMAAPTGVSIRSILR